MLYLLITVTLLPVLRAQHPPPATGNHTCLNYTWCDTGRGCSHIYHALLTQLNGSVMECPKESFMWRRRQNLRICNQASTSSKERTAMSIHKGQHMVEVARQPKEDNDLGKNETEDEHKLLSSSLSVGKTFTDVVVDKVDNTCRPGDFIKLDLYNTPDVIYAGNNTFIGPDKKSSKVISMKNVDLRSAVKWLVTQGSNIKFFTHEERVRTAVKQIGLIVTDIDSMGVLNWIARICTGVGGNKALVRGMKLINCSDRPRGECSQD